MIEERNLDSRREAILEQDGVRADQYGYKLSDGTIVERIASPLTNLQCGLEYEKSRRLP